MERIVAIVSDAAHKLRNYTNVLVSNSDAGFPPEVACGGQSINGRDWPSSQQLAEALAAYHSTRHDAQNAWRAIPDSLRKVVQEPPQ